jgi:alanyl-tRNA synthetase
LPSLEYRSKLDITENVRLVKIGDVDTCACCAPHVSYTGEIGLIKILESMNHRGGMRIWMVAGVRALRDYRIKYDNIRKISAALSTPQHETADTLKRYMQDVDQLRYKLKLAGQSLAEAYAASVMETSGDALYVFKDLGTEEIRAFVNAAIPKIGGILIVLYGTEGDYKYLITSSTVNLSVAIKDANAALRGRGGGKPNAVQGSFSATLAEIKSYFNV